MPSAIDPSAIPGAHIDPDAIETNAATVGTVAGQVSEHGSNVHFKWQGMAGVYEAPESGTLLGLMAPVSSQSTQVSDNLAEVSAALTAFAEDVRPIKAELDSLRVQAETFRDDIRGGVTVREINPAWTATQGYYGSTAPATYQGNWGGSTSTSSAAAPEQYRNVTKEWHESQEHVDRNNELIAAVNAQQVLLWEAERACANRIRALYGADPLRSAQSEDDALGYGIDEIPEGTDMPWGAEVERTEGCGEAAVNFVFKDFLWEGIVVGGIWGTVTGLGTLVLGYNPETGDFFSSDAYGAAWGNLGMLLFSGAANTGILAPIFHSDSLMQAMGMDGFLPQEVRDFKAQADEAAINTGKALIAWDKWADDPGTALGESVFNIGTALIPVGGAAVAGVKTASAAASVVAKAARVVDFIDPAALAMNGAMRLGGAGLHSLDGLIGRLGNGATDGFHLDPATTPFVADDATSALQALDGAGVDMTTVTARVENGIPVYEFPPTREIPSGRIEMPAGSFDSVARPDAPVVRTGSGEDANVPAPAREPELVGAGVRGEAGPAPVNSIVEDAPVRTESSGPGESTVVREPATDSGGSRPGGGDGTGGGAAGRGEDGVGSGRGDAGSGRGDEGSGRGDEGANAGRGDEGSGRGDEGSGRGDEGSNAGRGDEGANAGRGEDGSGRGEDADVRGDEPDTSSSLGEGGRNGADDGASGAVRPDGGDAAWRSSEQGDLYLTSPEKARIDEFLDVSRAAEPRITGDLTRIVGNQPGMRLEGLEFRLKGEESMYRKVSSELADDLPGLRQPVEAALTGMKDSVRYTVIIPADGYSAGVRGVVDDLIAEGYHPFKEMKNSWGGSGYQGINSNWLDPVSGRVIEVQFHTDASFAAKMQTHTLYELERLPGQTPERLAELRAQQQDIFDGVPQPADVADVALPSDAAIVQRASGSSAPVVGPGDVSATLTDAQMAQMRADGWRVAFFDDAASQTYYSGPSSTLGAPGRAFFVMPVEDAGVIRNAHDAARHTGMSPATQNAYVTGGEIHGIAFPSDGLPQRLPTAADAQKWPHFLEGGHTAVRGEGRYGGYLVNETRELVIPGGTQVMPNAFRFRLDDGAWIVERVW